MSISFQQFDPNSITDCHEVIRQMAQQCQDWAVESSNDGWSTHQVNGNQNAATQLFAFLGRKRAAVYAPKRVSGRKVV